MTHETGRFAMLQHAHAGNPAVDVERDDQPDAAVSVDTFVERMIS